MASSSWCVTVTVRPQSGLAAMLGRVVMSVVGPSRHLLRRSDMSGFGVKAEVAGARSKRRF
jgi:hypothetical protein